MQYCTHKARGGLYEAHPMENGKISVSPQGGGFARLLNQEDFGREFDKVAPEFNYRAGTVTADFLPTEVILPCYTNGKRWNGWGMPSFVFDVARTLMGHMPELRFDEEKDCFVWTPHDSDEQETFEASTITIDGQTIKVYPVGSGSWCWDSVAMDDELTEERAEERWHIICNEQGWDEASQILHLEGFLRVRGLLRDFVQYVSRAAMEETPDARRFDKDTIVAQMKRDVSAFIAANVIPASVTSFSELQDHIDANSLGGFCDDEFADALIAHFGGRDADDGMPDAMITFINACQAAVDEWLRAGRPAADQSETS